MQQYVEIIRFPEPVAYREAMRVQHERRVAVEEGRLGNALFVLEHTPVITLGRRARTEDLLLTETELADRGIDLCETDRGGGVTYHGPGQLVAYPVLDLHGWRLSVKWYLRALEEVTIRVLAAYGLQGERVSGYTGVWVNGAKVAAIGVAIHDWVTSHGTALNVDPNMGHFQSIVPCGIADKPVTTLRQLLGAPPPLPRVAEEFERQFGEFFGDVPSP